MSERVVVIGSNSFSGSHYVNYLLQQNVEVVGISRSAELADVFLPYKDHSGNASFSFHQRDLNEDLDEIIRLVDIFQTDYVVNFASQSMVAESWTHPEHWFQTNTVATIKLHDRLRHCDSLKRYVHISTPEVYGHCEGLVGCDTSFNPSTPYAVSRAAADMSLMSFYRNYEFPVVFTRAANVYGPGQQLYRIVPRTILYFLTGRKLQLHGGGHSVRSFIHIGDVVNGTARVMREGTPPDVFHFSTDENISIRSLVERIADQLNISFDEHVEIVDERPGKDAAYLLDSRKACDELGWEPSISLDDGISQTISWVSKNLNVLEEQSLEYVHRA